MKQLLGLSVLLISLATIVYAQQRVAPGVPPQRYEQGSMHNAPQMPSHQQMQPPPPPGQQVPQMQQQHVQYQQPMQQQQQIPQQQIPQQQVPQQQVPLQQVPQQQQHAPAQGMHPPQQGHGHGHQQQMLNTANIMQEKQHIQEHMDIPLDTSKMTEQELQFHYFKMHDADRNDKLDGCELIKSLIHWHGENSEKAGGDGPRPHSDEELESLVDVILKELDKNDDGFVDYVEYKQASSE